MLKFWVNEKNDEPGKIHLDLRDRIFEIMLKS